MNPIKANHQTYIRLIAFEFGVSSFYLHIRLISISLN